MAILLDSVLNGTVMCVEIKHTYSMLVQTERCKKTSEGEPVVCASGVPPFSQANVPIINVELSNKIIKCLVDTGCFRSIVSRCLVKKLGLKVSVCKEAVSLMNGSISYCNECCVCDVN